MNKSSNPPFASKLPPMCNAWIFLNEDEPSGTNYNSPTSAYQRIINKELYQVSDIKQGQAKNIQKILAK